jgi:hypothetical protein
MTFKKIFLFAALSLWTWSYAHSYGIGLSSFPMAEEAKTLSAELTGIMTDDGGAGLQARYSQRLTSRFHLDAGAGLGAGDRSMRIFAGIDSEIYPDYMNQPRISVKSWLSRAEEYDRGRTHLGVAPVVSKGFSFWGKEAFPYVAIPLTLALDGSSKTYETTLQTSLGINGNLPIEGYEKFLGTVEFNLDLKDSFTGILVGLAYPFE